MENELLRVMDIFKKGNEISRAETETLKRRINEMLKANTALMDKAKDYRSDACLLCDFIKNNIQTDDYIIMNLLKKYERKNYEITQNRKFNLY